MKPSEQAERNQENNGRCRYCGVALLAQAHSGLCDVHWRTEGRGRQSRRDDETSDVVEVAHELEALV